MRVIRGLTHTNRHAIYVKPMLEYLYTHTRGHTAPLKQAPPVPVCQLRRNLAELSLLKPLSLGAFLAGYREVLD